MKYEIDLHTFSYKLKQAMIKKELIDKKGNPDSIKLHNLLYPNLFITEEDLKIDRQKTIDQTRKLRNWIKGVNYPQKIEDILDLCNVLEVDLDYFFTEMNCVTHDIQFIQNETGLSEKAINKLKLFSTYKTGKTRVMIIDYLLNNELFTNFLTDKIIQYYEKYVDYQNGRKEYDKKQKINPIELLKNYNPNETELEISRKKLNEYKNSMDATQFTIQNDIREITNSLVEDLYNKNNKMG